jgi:hypothetical protein
LRRVRPQRTFEGERASAGVDHEIGVDDESQPACATLPARVQGLARDAEATKVLHAQPRGREGAIAQHALGLARPERQAEHAQRLRGRRGAHAAAVTRAPARRP